MREYNKIPGYEKLTPLDARFRYMHDLLREYQGLSGKNYGPCSKISKTDGCRYCSFSGHLGGNLNVPCNWRAEENPDAAIHILEKLLGKDVKVEEPEMSQQTKIEAIADYYGTDNQISIAQEELAELIQALSKYRRADDGDAFHKAVADITEEMADVAIMLQQLRYLLVIDATDVEATIKMKIDRQLRRIDEEDV